jgi:hypothetical protein
MRTLLIGLVLVGSSFLPGCSEVPGTGNATIRWGIGLVGSCDEAGISTVTVALADGSGDVVAAQDASCASGRIDLNDVPVGIYRVVVVGFDAEGFAAYEGEAEDIRITEGLESGPWAVRMSPRPAAIGVTWYFTGGRLCTAYDVIDVAVHLYRADAEVFAGSSECADGVVDIDELDAGVYDVLVEGFDRTGMPLYAATLRAVDLPPGHHVEVAAPLDRCDGDCL